MENPAPCHADVQMTVLRSLDPQVVIYLFFKITDPDLFRRQLQEGGSFSDLGEEARFKTEAWRIEKERSDRPNAQNSKQAEKAEQSGHASKPLVGRFSNVAFTFAGLTKLDVDPDTLATFPQPFRDGMAARATILGDKGDAAPEKWDGYLGSLQIDGVMWLNFRLSSRCADDILAEYEKRLDQAKAVFPSAWFPPCPAPKMRRGGAEEEGSKPADDGGAPKPIEGAEVLHVEFGMANYAQEGEGKPFRVEHFGYRDGVSQPYANLDLDPPPPGGGTPRDNGSWAPVATGEILLGHLDEDGRVQHLPANRHCGQMAHTWRCGSSNRTSSAFAVFSNGINRSREPRWARRWSGDGPTGLRWSSFRMVRKSWAASPRHQRFSLPARRSIRSAVPDRRAYSSGKSSRHQRSRSSAPASPVSTRHILRGTAAAGECRRRGMSPRAHFRVHAGAAGSPV